VSRVRENRTPGSMGGGWKRGDLGRPSAGPGPGADKRQQRPGRDPAERSIATAPASDPTNLHIQTVGDPEAWPTRNQKYDVELCLDAMDVPSQDWLVLAEAATKDALESKAVDVNANFTLLEAGKARLSFQVQRLDLDQPIMGEVMSELKVGVTVADKQEQDAQEHQRDLTARVARAFELGSMSRGALESLREGVTSRDV